MICQLVFYYGAMIEIEGKRKSVYKLKVNYDGVKNISAFGDKEKY